jgi:hypothetical protein
MNASVLEIAIKHEVKVSRVDYEYSKMLHLLADIFPILQSSILLDHNVLFFSITFIKIYHCYGLCLNNGDAAFLQM